MQKIQKIIFKYLHTLRKFYRKVLDIKTFGVRALVVRDNKILLVRHRYNDLWVMPGGKVEKNETAEKAVIKELKEEVGIIIQKPEYLLGTYKNISGGKNDEVTVFVISDFSEIKPFKRSFLNWIEIKDLEWFSINDLPTGLSGATKNRIAEFQTGNRNIAGKWN